MGADGDGAVTADTVPAAAPRRSRFAREAGRAVAVMAVVNLTPDSFSDGGAYATPAAAIAAAMGFWQAGADLIDLGAESTRPGAAEVPAGEQIARLLPVLRPLVAAGVAVSVDTRSAAVMRAVLDAGAVMINDVSGLAHDPAACGVIAASGCDVVIMHMRGTPQSMPGLAEYTDPVAEVRAELAARIEAAVAAGIARTRIIADPGIGFAKDAAQSAALLRGLAGFAGLAPELLVGVSRKRVIGALGGQAEPALRDAGSIAAGLFAAAGGASLLRVHDVAGHLQALRVWQALAGFGSQVI